MPAHIYDNIKKLNPEYNYLLLDFDDGKEIIRREFHDVLLKDKIINAMRKFKKNNEQLLETNLCLLSNEIYCENYNIYKHKKILFHELKIMIDKNIHNLKNKIYLESEIPIYTKKWQEFCKKNPNKSDEIIRRLRGETNPSWIANRFPDTIILYDPEIYN